MGPDESSTTAVRERTATTTPEPPGADDLIIKEARRRHRRRILGVTVVAAALAVTGFELASTGGAARRQSHARTLDTHPRPLAPGLSSCAVGQLTATVVFQSGSDLGAIRLTNTAAARCTLSGRPTVTIVAGSGRPLVLNESAFARAGLPAPPTQPVALSANRALPQGIVELDWTWCGAPPGPVSFKIEFRRWPQALTVPYSAVAPAGFVPAGCGDSGLRPLLAVDGVRGIRPDGVVTTGP
jgi:hypothetical protein